MAISYDVINWNVVVEDTLADAWDLGGVCDMPLEEFEVVAHGRYVKFTAKNFHGNSAGINYITFKFMF